MLKAQRFKDVYEGRCHSIYQYPSKDIKFANNQQILQQIIEAVVHCAEHGIALHGHREKEDQNLDESRQHSPRSGNFIIIVKYFAKHDDILRSHFFKGPRSAQYISARIQNEIIDAIAEFVREKICGVLNENINFCITADQVTHEHANKEVLLVCLRFLQNIGAKVTVQ